MEALAGGTYDCGNEGVVDDETRWAGNGASSCLRNPSKTRGKRNVTSGIIEN